MRLAFNYENCSLHEMQIEVTFSELKIYAESEYKIVQKNCKRQT